ncbi:MAG: methyltransferase domain-containing protein [Deltaproteobacteria bacterium]|nr:methyltransferase domain-containing protein [Deltaproteobacteria bacterium]
MKICVSCLNGFVGDGWKCPYCGNSPDIPNGIAALASTATDSNDGFSPELFGQLYHLEENHFWFQFRNKLIAWAFEKHFKGARNFFEIGCGNGVVLKHFESKFPDLVLTGSDIFMEGLKFARNRLSRVTLNQIDLRSIPFENEFDVVGMFDVLEHVTEDESALKEVYKAVKSKGGVIITVPQHPALWSETDEVAFHKRRYTRNELRVKLMRAGFDIVSISSFMTILLPLMIANRLFRKSGACGGTGELEMPLFLNYLLGRICAIELPIIRAGVSLPFGGSLLAIAKKP